MPPLGPDPLTFGTDPERTHVGNHLRRQRTYARIGAEQLAQADGTWTAEQVILLEQQRIVKTGDFTRYRAALALAVRYLQESQS